MKTVNDSFPISDRLISGRLPLMHIDSQTPKLREVFESDQRRLVPCVIMNEAHYHKGVTTWFQCHPETWSSLSDDEKSRFRTFDVDVWRDSKQLPLAHLADSPAGETAPLDTTIEYDKP